MSALKEIAISSIRENKIKQYSFHSTGWGGRNLWAKSCYFMWGFGGCFCVCYVCVAILFGVFLFVFPWKSVPLAVPSEIPCTALHLLFQWIPKGMALPFIFFKVFFSTQSKHHLPSLIVLFSTGGKRTVEQKTSAKPERMVILFFSFDVFNTPLCFPFLEWVPLQADMIR